MPRYRIDLLDADDSVVGRPTMVECETDNDALRIARAFASGYAIQIWRDDRYLIAMFPADQQRDAAPDGTADADLRPRGMHPQKTATARNRRGLLALNPCPVCMSPAERIIPGRSTRPESLKHGPIMLQAFCVGGAIRRNKGSKPGFS
jgi:hypothetical protein